MVCVAGAWGSTIDGVATIEAVVFDFDGLILDTETPIFRAWSEAYAEHGCEVTLDDWALHIGSQNGLDIESTLVERAAVEVALDDVRDRCRTRIRELLVAEEVRPGVVDWITALAADGIPLAVASSSRLGWVDEHLARLGLRDHFAHLACFSDGGLACKPAPDTYLDACRALGVDPAHAVAVEDSPNGVKAAKAAGMHAIAVPNELTRHMDLSAADLVLDSLATTTPAEAFSRLA